MDRSSFLLVLNFTPHLTEYSLVPSYVARLGYKALQFGLDSVVNYGDVASEMIETDGKSNPILAGL